MTDAFAGFKDGPIFLDVAGGTTQIAGLDVPPGRYATQAKLFLGPPGAGRPTNRSAEFELRAEEDFDRTRVTTDETIAFASVALQVVHEFHGNGRVQLTGHFVEPGDNLKTVSWVKITATRVDGLQNRPMP